MLKANAQSERGALRWAAAALTLSLASVVVLAPLGVYACPVIAAFAFFSWRHVRPGRSTARAVVFAMCAAALLMPFAQIAGFTIFLTFFAEPSFSSAYGAYTLIFLPPGAVLLFCIAATVASMRAHAGPRPRTQPRNAGPSVLHPGAL